ncbi:MAG TPA: 6-carboxytetrahydropterin synthase QueD [Alphaproteobacteria bacterium]|nr:6-carboxytetrahydropterin synthase QueD [Alphaproteobacteria bacterium]HAJ46353.1 6-carboxytetrahydropterin synthase QueD [Alphaproteobacteria bacterium]
MEISKTFLFDAAHFLPHAPAGHPNARMHGHSFQVTVTLAGEPDPARGWLRDLGEVAHAVEGVRDALDHRTLNEIDGLAIPTLERLSAWIFARLKPALPELVSVTVRRDSLGESCTFRETRP